MYYSLYEVEFICLDGDKFHELFYDREKAMEYACRGARNYEATYVFGYYKDDNGKYCGKEILHHLGKDFY